MFSMECSIEANQEHEKQNYEMFVTFFLSKQTILRLALYIRGPQYLQIPYQQIRLSSTELCPLPLQKCSPLLCRVGEPAYTYIHGFMKPQEVLGWNPHGYGGKPVNYHFTGVKKIFPCYLEHCEILGPFS